MIWGKSEQQQTDALGIAVVVCRAQVHYDQFPQGFQVPGEAFATIPWGGAQEEEEVLAATQDLNEVQAIRFRHFSIIVAESM